MKKIFLKQNLKPSFCEICGNHKINLLPSPSPIKTGIKLIIISIVTYIVCYLSQNNGIVFQFVFGFMFFFTFYIFPIKYDYNCQNCNYNSYGKPKKNYILNLILELFIAVLILGILFFFLYN